MHDTSYDTLTMASLMTPYPLVPRNSPLRPCSAVVFWGGVLGCFGVKTPLTPKTLQNTCPAKTLQQNVVW